jgi:hypothetical protein
MNKETSNLANEMEMAAARLVVRSLQGETAQTALRVLEIAKSLVVDEARSAVLSVDFRTEQEKKIAIFLEPLLTRAILEQKK